MQDHRFADYFNDACAERQSRHAQTVPPAIASDLLAALDTGYDALWGVIGTAMRAHGVSGDDLGWDDSEARSALARAVVDLVAGNIPAQPYECTVVLRMPADDGKRARPEDVTDVLGTLDGVEVIAWHDENLIGDES